MTGRPLHLDISDLPMKKGVISNRNKFVLGPSGSGKSFFMNHLVRQYYEQNSHIVLIDTGNSYQGLCELIHRKTKGEDGIYYTYTEEKPISFNPFFTDDYKFSVEKKDSIKTLLLALWKGEDEKITKTESGELGSAVSAYIRRIQQNRDIAPSFDTFYEYMLNDYRKELAARDIKVSREDFNIDNFLTTLRQYYKGGRYDFLLNSNENIDLLHKRFIVFEIDSIKDNAELFPVVTIIIMEAFINKLRRLKGVRKMLICEEAWKALSSPSMSEYLKYMYKTVRKYFGEAIVVTQEVDDIISSPIVKEAIIDQLGTANPFGPEEVHEQVRRHPVDARADGQGEVADTLHQPRQPSRTEVQGGVDRSERGAVGGVRHGGVGCRVPDLYHRGEREDGGVRTGGRVGRRLGACHQAAGGNEV